MSYKPLKKGLEVELYAGTEDGQVLPLSGKVKDHFSEFSQEPDERNLEYITKPTISYSELFKEIVQPRIKLRQFLKEKDNLTLIPGSTIPLSFDKKFYYSKPDDEYHNFILQTYNTNIITTSLHINFGVEDYGKLFKLLNALRLDMPLLLALSASSCFFDGKATDYNSYRWHAFPKTPSYVPFFSNHDEYIFWTNEQLLNKTMFNVRHLWTSIRPNGDNRPTDLNRIEIRICDFVSDTRKALAIVAFIECLIQKHLIDDKIPTVLNTTQNELAKLVTIMMGQEELVAKDGLNASIWDWRRDTTNKTSNIIESLYKDMELIAKELNILTYLNPILDILTNGNEATNFMSLYKKNNSIPQTIKYFIEQFTLLDFKSQDMIKSKIAVK